MRPSGVDRFVEEDDLASVKDLDELVKDASWMLGHKCNERCNIAVGKGVCRCRKLNNVKMRKDNTEYLYTSLPNDYSTEFLERLVRIGLVEPLCISEEGYMKSF